MRLIDADALIEKLDCLFKEPGGTEDYMTIGYDHGVGDSIAIIKGQPTIDPVKQGKWIHDGLQHRGGVDWMHCSECGKRDVFAAKSQYHYCYNCGARMKGEEGRKGE